ncbi:MAG TPA: ComEA family DNA-binding protein [Gaiellaceae bacterium]
MGLHALAPAQRRLLAVAVLLVIAVVLGLRHLYGGKAASPAGAFAPLSVAAAPVRAAAGGGGKLLVVDVAGAVRRPGLYRLPSGTRIADAVARAGGAGAKADLDLVNLAAPLADGEQVVVPQRGAAAVSGGPSQTAPLDLNSASAEQLDALPGIGPSTAAKIVAFREAHGPFRTVEGLDAVPGIGPSRIDQLKGLVIP